MNRHITAATTGATRIGIVITVRTMAMPGRWRSLKIHAASRKPSAISAVSAVRVKTKLRKARPRTSRTGTDSCNCRSRRSAGAAPERDFACRGTCRSHRRSARSRGRAEGPRSGISGQGRGARPCRHRPRLSISARQGCAAIERQARRHGRAWRSCTLRDTPRARTEPRRPSSCWRRPPRARRRCPSPGRPCAA